MDIKDYRLNKRYTRQVAAEKIGIDAHYLYYLERGEKEPSLAVIRKMAQAYGTTPVKIFLALK